MCLSFVCLYVIGILILALYCYDRRLFKPRDCENEPDRWIENQTNKTTARYNIAVVTVSDNYIGPDTVMASIENKKLYAASQGYDFITPTVSERRKLVGNSDPKRAKFALISKVFQSEKKYDALLWIDMDAVIMRHDVDMKVLLQEMILLDKYIAIAPDAIIYDMYNSGVFLIRNGKWTTLFLQEFKNAHLLIQMCRGLNLCPPGLYDQNIIAFLRGVWPTCAWHFKLWPFAPIHPKHNHFKKMIFEVPACVLNAVPEEASPRTFIQHCYGGNIADTMSSLSRKNTKGKGLCVLNLLNQSMANQGRNDEYYSHTKTIDTTTI